MLTDFEVGWFDKGTRSYRSTTFGTPHEVLSLNGSVAVVEGEDDVMPHVHASLAGPDHSVVGGHLYKATVAVLNEVAVLRVEAPMRRRLNPETGLKELDLGQP